MRGLVVPPGVVPTLEWTSLTRDGLGNSLQLSTLDELVVLHSPYTVQQAEANLLHLERDALESWTLPIEGPSADLSKLVGASPFEGVDEDGSWWLGLRCTTCTHPAPRFLTRMESAW